MDQQTYLKGSYLKEQLKWPPRVSNPLLVPLYCRCVFFFVTVVDVGADPNIVVLL